MQETGLAEDRGAPRPDDRQWQEVAVVAREPRQQSRAQKRGLAGSGRAEDDEEPWRRGLAQAPQQIERLDDRRVTAEEDAGGLGFERPQAPGRRSGGGAPGR